MFDLLYSVPSWAWVIFAGFLAFFLDIGLYWLEIKKARRRKA